MNQDSKYNERRQKAKQKKRNENKTRWMNQREQQTYELIWFLDVSDVNLLIGQSSGLASLRNKTRKDLILQSKSPSWLFDCDSKLCFIAWFANCKGYRINVAGEAAGGISHISKLIDFCVNKKIKVERLVGFIHEILQNMHKQNKKEKTKKTQKVTYRLNV